MGYALVTGGSKGIGYEIARELASRKLNLLLIARSEPELKAASDKLKNQYKIEVDFLAIDLSVKGSPEVITDWIKGKNLPLSILVNNAGYGLWGNVEELTLKSQEEMMMVNIVNLVKMTGLLIPILRKNTPSYILNISSTAAYQAVAGLNVYSASKAFVLSFSRALRKELKGSGVSVSCLSPGTTSTNFMNRAGMTTKEMINRAEKFTMPADTVAKFGVAGMFKGKNEMIPGFVNKLSVALIPFTPKWLTEKIAENLYRK